MCLVDGHHVIIVGRIERHAQTFRFVISIYFGIEGSAVDVETSHAWNAVGSEIECLAIGSKEGVDDRESFGANTIDRMTLVPLTLELVTIFKTRTCAEDLIIGCKILEIRFPLVTLYTPGLGTQAIVIEEIFLRGKQTVDDDHILTMVVGSLTNLQDCHQTIGSSEPFFGGQGRQITLKGFDSAIEIVEMLLDNGHIPQCSRSWILPDGLL